jgi:hypothetical protein
VPIVQLTIRLRRPRELAEERRGAPRSAEERRGSRPRPAGILRLIPHPGDSGDTIFRRALAVRLERVFYCALVSQLSLFSADARSPRVSDLAGLLCGPGQMLRFGAGDQARLSIVLPDPARVPAVAAACAAIGIMMKTVQTESGATALRSAFRCDLVELARAWTSGAVKTVPAGWQLDGPALRLWALAAGRPDERGGYLLALDPHAPETHLGLVAAATRAGISPARVGNGQALRISGTRRVQRLVELVGPVPPRADTADWPRCWGRAAS